MGSNSRYGEPQIVPTWMGTVGGMREAGTRVAIVCGACGIIDIRVSDLWPDAMSLVDRRGTCPDCGRQGCRYHAANPGGPLRACSSTL